MWRLHLVTSFTPGRTAWLAAVIVCLLGTASSLAQDQRDQPGQRLDTGYFNIFGGHSVVVTVTDVGAPNATSFVRITVFGATATPIVKEGTLTPAQPMQLDLPLVARLGRALVRVSVSIAGLPDRGSAPIVGIDDIDPTSQTIIVRGDCSPPGHDHDGMKDQRLPPCPGWQVTDFAALPD
jgi:hypothetical protein